MLHMANRFLSFISAVLCCLAMAGSTWAQDGALQANSTVMVVGGTGRTGALVVDGLIKNGHAVRGLSRRVEAARQEKSSVNWFSGDVRDASTFGNAFDDVDAVIYAVGNTRDHDPENPPEQVYYRGVAAVVEAAKAGGADHFVLLSSAGVTDPNHPLNANGNAMAFKLKGEDALRRSGRTYTIVRPQGVWNEHRPGNGILMVQGDQLTWGRYMISRSDIAEVLIESVANPDAINKTFEIFSVVSQDPDGWRTEFGRLKPDG